MADLAQSQDHLYLIRMHRYQRPSWLLVLFLVLLAAIWTSPTLAIDTTLDLARRDDPLTPQAPNSENGFVGSSPPIAAPAPVSVSSDDNATPGTGTAPGAPPTTNPSPGQPSSPSPPSSSLNDTTMPYFPAKSESCQQCKAHYAQLSLCNQIANATLASIPRLGEGNVISGVNGQGDPTGRPGTPSDGSPPPQTVGGHNTKRDGNSFGTSSMSPSEFTVIMPFLQCICPNKGLAAVKVCQTCFRLTNQHNFLQEMTTQDVTNSLSAFAEACQESGDGTYIPPPVRRGPSASEAEVSNASQRMLVTSRYWKAMAGIVLVRTLGRFLFSF